MAGVPSSETVSWDAQASSTLANYQKTWVDNVSKINAFMYQLMKVDPRGYVVEQVEGLRMNLPLLYALGQADSYSGLARA